MLVANNISKQFSGVRALSDVSLELHPSKVNAIIGENGAGKSTLMKIFSGVLTRYEGDIFLDGKPVKFNSTKDAEEAGIAIIHQELNLVPYLSIAENIFLGRELVDAFGMVKAGLMKAKTKELLEKLHLEADPDTKIAELKVGQQQMVEIAKALYTNASIIIMDEPTSAISDKEVKQLFHIIEQLKSEGKTIVYISHKLNELFTIADRYIVLRDGMVIESGDFAAIDSASLIQKMTGRSISTGSRIADSKGKPVVLQAENIRLKHPMLRSKLLLQNISFELHKGEILGIYGLMGAGRTELLETIFGLHAKRSSGTIIMNGKTLAVQSPSDAIDAGIALVPEDRKLHGLILNQTVRSNISITILQQLQDWGFMLNFLKEKKKANDFIDHLSIKTSSDNIPAKNLSGGNQQKIVLAKWLATNPQVLLLDEPTRGIDINAKAEIYELMKKLAQEGMSIIMVSSELPEILAISDNVLVMTDGSIAAHIPIEEATETTILQYAIHK